MDDTRPGTDLMPEDIKQLMDDGGAMSVLASEIHRLAVIIDSLHQRVVALEKQSGTGISTL
jgi:hypothetical protein